MSSCITLNRFLLQFQQIIILKLRIIQFQNNIMHMLDHLLPSSGSKAPQQRDDVAVRDRLASAVKKNNKIYNFLGYL